MINAMGIFGFSKILIACIFSITLPTLLTGLLSDTACWGISRGVFNHDRIKYAKCDYLRLLIRVNTWLMQPRPKWTNITNNSKSSKRLKCGI